eukprot:377284-Pelagomonas_calceolata.AAC.2
MHRTCSLIFSKKKKKKKLHRQRKLSLHQLRKERYIGSKSRESLSPEDERGINVGWVGFWQHAAPGPQCYDEWFFIFDGTSGGD